MHKQYLSWVVQSIRSPHTSTSQQSVPLSLLLASQSLYAISPRQLLEQDTGVCHLHLTHLSPAHTVGFWPRFGRLRQILKILKDSCNPRLKSVVFDRWFDMSTDSRLMAVAINFFLRLNSGSVRRFQTLSSSVTSPTTTVKPRTNRCAEPDDAISATTSNHENVETSQVDSTTGRKTY